jgi:putative queuosine salvage protein
MQATQAATFTRDEQLRELGELLRASKHVKVDDERIKKVAAIAPRDFATGWIRPFQDTDEHYGRPQIELTDLEQLQYSLVAAAQIWLIWERDEAGRARPLTMTVEGTKYVGSATLGACHARAIRSGQNILDAKVLANFAMKDVEDHYRDEASGGVKVQLLDERLANFRELGSVLLREFDGHFVNVLRRADGYLFRPDGNGLIQILERDFPRSFGDWPLAKLAYVFTFALLDLREARQFAPEIDALLRIKDLENLEGGADYYRPWFFLRVGVLAIDDELKGRLRRHELIEASSALENDYRAATIEAMRRLAKKMGGDQVAALRLLERETHAQALLRCRKCRVGISDEELPCPYRGICKATHEDHQLMECGFPLVLTSEY